MRSTHTPYASFDKSRSSKLRLFPILIRFIGYNTYSYHINTSLWTWIKMITQIHGPWWSRCCYSQVWHVQPQPRWSKTQCRDHRCSILKPWSLLEDQVVFSVPREHGSQCRAHQSTKSMASFVFPRGAWFATEFSERPWHPMKFCRSDCVRGRSQSCKRRNYSCSSR